jgi:PQQ system protein
VSDTAVDVSTLDTQNGVTLGRILGRGTVGQAEEGSGGKMTGTVRIPEDELVYEPSVLIMPHGGILELTLINDDKNTHCAVLPSNGDNKFIWLVNHSKGTATLELDGAGVALSGSRDLSVITAVMARSYKVVHGSERRNWKRLLIRSPAPKVNVAVRSKEWRARREPAASDAAVRRARPTRV